MNRTRRFFQSAGAAYLSTIANLAYTAISIPLALHYLPKQEFALWALVLQIGGYLMLLDLGMSSSVSRFLANHKDSIHAGEYGSVLRTGTWVFSAQALGIAIFTFFCAGLLPRWLEIPTPLEGEFKFLLLGLGMILSAGLALRSRGVPLWAHQRTDITHFSATANLLTALGVMAWGLSHGWGVYSFLAGSLAGSLWTWFLPWYACHRLKLFPSPGSAGSFDWALFVQIFRLGRDVLLMQLGGLLCSGSQIILVTKLLGLESAAIFSVATKTLAMGQQVLGRIVESSAPGLTELYVQGNRAIFTERFYQIVKATLALTILAATTLMLGNRSFVSFWTQGRIQWSVSGDILVGILLVSSVVTRCLQGAFGVSGDLSRIRFLPLMEGGAFILFCFWGRNHLSLSRFLFAALAANLVASFLPTIAKTHASFPLKAFWGRFFLTLVSFTAWALLCAFLNRLIPCPNPLPAIVFIGGSLASVFWVRWTLLSPSDRDYFQLALIRAFRGTRK